MKAAQVERLLIDAGVKFGVLTNVWLKNREMLFDGHEGIFPEDQAKDQGHVSRATDDQAKGVKNGDRFTFAKANRSVVTEKGKKNLAKVIKGEIYEGDDDKMIMGEIYEGGDDKVMKEKIFIKEDEEDKIEPRKCPHCGEVKHIKSMGRHIRMVHQTTKLKCNQCGLQLSSKEKLETHISKVHGRANEITKCSFCEEVFCGREKTNFHETMMHRGEVANSFKCELCEKSYKTRANMQRHTRTFH